MTQARTWYDDVRAFRGPQQRRGGGIVHAPDHVGPRTGGVDDRERADLVHGARQQVAHGRTTHSAVGFQKGGYLRVIRDVRAGARGVPHRGEGEPPVIGLGVVIQRRAPQLAIPQPRLRAAHLARREPAVTVHVAERGQGIVQPHPGPEAPGRHAAAAIGRKQERQGAHQVRRDAQENAAFATRLEDETEVVLLEVAQPSVHQARRPGAGAPGKISLVHQRGPKPSQRGIPRDAGPRHAATDDEEVDRLAAHVLERGGACSK